MSDPEVGREAAREADREVARENALGADARSTDAAPAASEPPAAAPLVPASAAPSEVRRVRGSRRVIRPGNEAADPTPHASTSRLEEDPEAGSGTAGPSAGAGPNDEQLKRDKPPHWG